MESPHREPVFGSGWAFLKALAQGHFHIGVYQCESWKVFRSTVQQSKASSCCEVADAHPPLRATCADVAKLTVRF